MTHCAHDGTRRDDESDGYLEWVEAFMETDPGDRHQVGLIVRDLLARVRRRDRTTSNVAALSARVVEAAVEEAMWRRQVDLQRPDVIDCTLRGLQIAEQELLSAVDTLLAAGWKP